LSDGLICEKCGERLLTTVGAGQNCPHRWYAWCPANGDDEKTGGREIWGVSTPIDALGTWARRYNDREGIPSGQEFEVFVRLLEDDGRRWSGVISARVEKVYGLHRFGPAARPPTIRLPEGW
jgi:hypothetical protein